MSFTELDPDWKEQARKSFEEYWKEQDLKIKPPIMAPSLEDRVTDLERQVKFLMEKINGT